MILKRMKRRHSRGDTIEFCETVRRLRPDAAFGADLIAGFPTETEAMFENTLALVDDAGLSYLHVFPFCPAQGHAGRAHAAAAAHYDQRTRGRLRAKGEVALRQRLANLIGTEQDVLVEKPGLGRTPCFAPVQFVGAGRARFTRPGEGRTAAMVQSLPARRVLQAAA